MLRGRPLAFLLLVLFSALVHENSYSRHGSSSSSSSSSKREGWGGSSSFLFVESTTVQLVGCDSMISTSPWTSIKPQALGGTSFTGAEIIIHNCDFHGGLKFELNNETSDFYFDITLLKTHVYGNFSIEVAPFVSQGGTNRMYWRSLKIHDSRIEESTFFGFNSSLNAVSNPRIEIRRSYLGWGFHLDNPITKNLTFDMEDSQLGSEHFENKGFVYNSVAERWRRQDHFQLLLRNNIFYGREHLPTDHPYGQNHPSARGAISFWARWHWVFRYMRWDLRNNTIGYESSEHNGYGRDLNTRDPITGYNCALDLVHVVMEDNLINGIYLNTREFQLQSLEKQRTLARFYLLLAMGTNGDGLYEAPAFQGDQYMYVPSSRFTLNGQQHFVFGNITFLPSPEITNVDPSTGRPKVISIVVIGLIASATASLTFKNITVEDQFQLNQCYTWDGGLPGGGISRMNVVKIEDMTFSNWWESHSLRWRTPPGEAGPLFIVDRCLFRGSRGFRLLFDGGNPQENMVNWTVLVKDSIFEPQLNPSDGVSISLEPPRWWHPTEERFYGFYNETMTQKLLCWNITFINCRIFGREFSELSTQLIGGKYNHLTNLPLGAAFSTRAYAEGELPDTGEYRQYNDLVTLESSTISFFNCSFGPLNLELSGGSTIVTDGSTFLKPKEYAAAAGQNQSRLLQDNNITCIGDPFGVNPCGWIVGPSEGLVWNYTTLGFESNIKHMKVYIPLRGGGAAPPPPTTWNPTLPPLGSSIRSPLWYLLLGGGSVLPEDEAVASWEKDFEMSVRSRSFRDRCQTYLTLLNLIKAQLALQTPALPQLEYDIFCRSCPTTTPSLEKSNSSALAESATAHPDSVTVSLARVKTGDPSSTVTSLPTVSKLATDSPDSTVTGQETKSLSLVNTSSQTPTITPGVTSSQEATGTPEKIPTLVEPRLSRSESNTKTLEVNGYLSETGEQLLGGASSTHDVTQHTVGRRISSTAFIAQSVSKHITAANLEQTLTDLHGGRTPSSLPLSSTLSKSADSPTVSTSRNSVTIEVTRSLAGEPMTKTREITQSTTIQLPQVEATVSKAQLQSTQAAATGTVLVSAAAGGGGGAADLQGLMVIGLMACSPPQVRGVAQAGQSSVIPLQIGSSDLSGLLGGVVILSSLGALQFIASVAAKFVMKKKSNGTILGGMAVTRFPGGFLNTGQGLLWQGISFEGLRLLGGLTKSPEPEIVGAGLILSFFYLVSFALTAWGMIKCSDAKFHTWVIVKPPQKLLWICPKGYWKETKAFTAMMRASYGSFIDSKYAWVHMIGSTRALLVSLLVLKGQDFGLSCKTQGIILACIYAIFVIPLVLTRPMVIPVQVLANAVTSTLTVYIILATSGAFGDGQGENAAAAMTITSFASLAGMVAVVICRILRMWWVKKEEAALKAKEEEEQKDGQDDEEDYQEALLWVSEEGAGKSRTREWKKDSSKQSRLRPAEYDFHQEDGVKAGAALLERTRPPQHEIEGFLQNHQREVLPHREEILNPLTQSDPKKSPQQHTNNNRKSRFGKVQDEEAGPSSLCNPLLQQALDEALAEQHNGTRAVHVTQARGNQQLSVPQQRQQQHEKNRNLRSRYRPTDSEDFTGADSILDLLM